MGEGKRSLKDVGVEGDSIMVFTPRGAAARASGRRAEGLAVRAPDSHISQLQEMAKGTDDCSAHRQHHIRYSDGDSPVFV